MDPVVTDTVKEAVEAVVDAVNETVNATGKPVGFKGEVITLWSKIEKNTDKIAIQSFTVP